MNDLSVDYEAASKKEGRAERFKSILKRHGMPSHGAATAISRQLGVSDATASAWMKGSMPRDPEVLFLFCDVYDVDPYWWTDGKERPREGLDTEKLVRTVKMLEEFKEKESLVMSVEQTALFIAKCYADPVSAPEYLESMAPFFRA